MARPLRPSSLSKGFSLLELLVATGVLSVVVVGLYAAFLKANEYAVTARVNTSAKIVLERALNYVLTVDWNFSMDQPGQLASNQRPQVLTDTNGSYLAYQLDQGDPAQVGLVSLFTDPSDESVISGTLYRKVTPVSAPGDSTGQSLVRVILTIDNIRFRGRQLPPVTTYTVRARND